MLRRGSDGQERARLAVGKTEAHVRAAAIEQLERLEWHRKLSIPLAPELLVIAERAVSDAARAAPGAHVVEVDVADRAALVWLEEDVEKRFGGTDVLVNNAGIVRRSSCVGELSAGKRRSV